MSAPSDPRAVNEYRVPAGELKVGDLVNTSPGEGDWQQVLGVYRSPSDAAPEPGLRRLLEVLAGRYVVVRLTDLLPVDGGIYFSDGTALVAGADESDDVPVADAIGDATSERVYLYTKYEVVSIRAS
jgi:hypothetical protein